MAQTGPRDKATIESLKERMARDPLSRAFLQLAEEYRKAGRFEEAVQVCNEGLTRHPGYHTARIALGRTYLDAGDLENAHRSLSEVLDSMPENHLAAKLLAEVQLRLGNRAGAADTYRAILSHYPGDREVEGLLNELGEGKGAVPAFPEFLDSPGATGGPLPGATTSPPEAVNAPELTPESPAPLEFVDGGEPSPDSEPVVEEMAAATTLVDVQAPLSSTSCDRAGSNGPAEADALQTNTLAELYLRQGLVDKALEVYRAMLQVDPGNTRARQRLADLSGEEAIDELEDAAPSEALTSSPMSIEQSAVAEPTTSVAGPESDPAPPTEPSIAYPGGPVEAANPVTPVDPVEAVGQAATPAGAVGNETEMTVGLQSPTGSAASTIDRLGRWLRTIQSGSTTSAADARR